MIHALVEGVRAAPFWSDLQGYNGRRAALDLQAGLSVAIFAVPQAMAYAMLAGLPPVNGLYAAVMSIIAALWGASPYINSGPSHSASLLAAAALAPWVHRSGALTLAPDALLALVFQFTLMVGAIRIAMGLLRLGQLVRFVPESAFGRTSMPTPCRHGLTARYLGRGASQMKRRLATLKSAQTPPNKPVSP